MKNLIKNFYINSVIEDRKKIPFITLYLARIEKEKVIYELIEAFKLIKRNYNDVYLIIAGDGSQIKAINNIINNDDRIKMVGYVTGGIKTDIYKKSSIYVLPSYTECMPLSVLEAMAFGLPIICSEIGGLSDIIRDKENGILVRCKDINSLYLAIENLYLNISYINFNKATYFYSKQVVSRLEAIYKKNIYNYSL
ncbi:MAG TPA: glycosyltransferase family 4 protein [Candidatus Cloacimonas sp.]|nr:glycosyltransferase family 4 protein [Candidatus Cloacimonas sp.]